MSNNPSKKVVTLILGFVILILGIALTLAWWPNVVLLFKGIVGIALALIGLLMLYTVKDFKK